MKAAHYTAYGPPSTIAFRDAPIPTPAQGELLVRVRAAVRNLAPEAYEVRHLEATLPVPAEATELLGRHQAFAVRLGDDVPDLLRREV